jgi:hypothetical protein
MKTIKWLSLVIALALSLSILGCEQTAVHPTTTTTTTTTSTTTTTTTSTTTTTYESYFPWKGFGQEQATYQVDSYKVNIYGTVETSSTTESWEDLGAPIVTGSSTIQANIRIDVISGGSWLTYYYSDNSSGLYYHGTQPTFEASLLLPYPPMVGTTWESGSFFGPNEVLTEETVVTAAGTFNCVKASYVTYPGAWDYRWYSQDAGLVKQYEGYGGVGSSHVTREIISKNF